MNSGSNGLYCNSGVGFMFAALTDSPVIPSDPSLMKSAQD